SVKQVQIVVPFEKTETVFAFLLDVLDIKNVMKFNADNAHVLQFRLPDEAINDTLEGLKSRGVGVEFGFIDILDIKASLPREISEDPKDQKIQREATLAVEEIYDNVKVQTALSFDFIAFIILAAVMAGFGLIQNNITVIVASMLLSPLMGPMLGVAFGYVVRDWDLAAKGTKNEFIALGLSFAVGVIMAILMPILQDPTLSPLMNRVDVDWNSTTWSPISLTEITRRGGFSPLDIGVAIFSGAAIAISVTRGDMSSLVGVAISAALMPPAVNVGMMISLGLIYGSAAGIQIGIGSFFLLGMNIILIDIFAILMFRIKKLTVIADKSASWTAVTAFRPMGSKDLYHGANAQATQKTESGAAKFTAAPVPTAPAPKAETPEKSEPEPEESDDG
ncbi:MAG: TIGR00341 family protein, partial [Candidatus Thorarchaeota archaeon]